MNIIANIKHELFSGWNKMEAIWIFLFLALQISVFIYQPESLLAVISSIAGLLCVVFVSKGKISNYFFGLIFSYTYFYLAWDKAFYGEMTTTLYVYIPAQFIGYFLWKAKMNHQSESNSVLAKALTFQGWLLTLASITIGSILFILLLNSTNGQSVTLDGITTVMVVAAQILMLLRYREQWIFWIVINILSIILWADTTAVYLMYGAYLLNSAYGYYNWTKLARQNQTRA